MNSDVRNHSAAAQGDPNESGFPKSKSQPISIIVPAHNEENYLAATLESISQAADKLKLDCELIVVNDASTDATPEIAARCGATVIDVDLRNIGAVRNAGAAAATHPWLMFVDADTRVLAKTIAGATAALADGAVGGGAWVELDATDRRSIKRSSWLLFWLLRFFWQRVGRWAAGCFMFCTREHFDSFGGFDEKYFAAEELFFSRSLKKLGKFVIVPEPVLTSPRKLHDYSTRSLIKFMLSPLANIWKPLQSRRGLEILYEDRK